MQRINFFILSGWLASLLKLFLCNTPKMPRNRISVSTKFIFHIISRPISSSLSESTNQALWFPDAAAIVTIVGRYCPTCLEHHTSSEVVKVIADHSANCWQHRHQATQWVERRLLRTTWPRVCVCLQSSEILYFSIRKKTLFNSKVTAVCKNTTLVLDYPAEDVVRAGNYSLP